MKDLSIDTLHAFRERFWASRPKPEARRSKIKVEIQKAHEQFMRRVRLGEINGSDYPLRTPQTFGQCASYFI